MICDVQMCRLAADTGMVTPIGADGGQKKTNVANGNFW